MTLGRRLRAGGDPWAGDRTEQGICLCPIKLPAGILTGSSPAGDAQEKMMRNKRCLRGRRWGVRMQTRLRGMASSPFLVGHFLPAAHSTQAVCKPAQQLPGHPNHFPWLQPVRSRGSPGQKSTVQSSPGWQPAVSSSLPLHIWKGSLRKGHTGHFPLHIWELRALPHCAGAGRVLLVLLFQAGPESKGNKSFFLAKGRAGWRQPQETRAGLFPGLLNSAFWCLNLALD